MSNCARQDAPPDDPLQLLEVTEQHGFRPFLTSGEDIPSFHVVVVALDAGQHVHHELVDVLHDVKRETGVRYFLLRRPSDEKDARGADFQEDGVTRTIVWLGPARDDSDAAVRCVSRLYNTPASSRPRKLWSRREGQALWDLAERPIWRCLSPRVLAASCRTWLYCGTQGVPWAALLSLRRMLLELSSTGRMAHHQFAHAIHGSQASRIVEATLSILANELSNGQQDFPPPAASLMPQSGMPSGMNELSSHLDTSIRAAETRWLMLDQSVKPLPMIESMSEAELDAEIARYAQLLQQMDIMEADLEHLDNLTTHVRCRQHEARTPRGSPEISP
ncbi:uncharacterized protein PV09_04826 [Verruconis gallopava]|uniref:Uncharacterized protein n=1 Tax=Verruconis gallopava TaxID=253628 RepID=A0A0D2AB63_9PEZI|nr:uncharacterized protein PV09_04826 [Verruconis gallopava]KIW03998.1 hypothetical protein PV09_04826 [Verruconis gallopava]